MDDYLGYVRAPRSNALACSYAFINRALELLCAENFDYEKAARQFAQSRDNDFDLFFLLPKDEQIIEKTIVENCGEMRHLKRALPKLTPAQIIQGVYAWKLHRLGERWRGREQVKITLRGAHTQTNDTQRESSPTLSVFSHEDDPKPQMKLVCAFCATPISPFWYKSPLYTSGPCLCVYCGQYWRKYAAETANAFITDKKRQAAFEHGSDEPGLGVVLPAHPVPESPLKPVQPVLSSLHETGRCVMCRCLEPKKQLCSCVQCGLIGHQGCIGVDENQIDMKSWLCDLCKNEQDPMSSIMPFCVLCGETPTDRKAHASHRGRKTQNDVDAKTLTALDVYKPTECNNWAHLLCALWMPGVLFGNTTTMQPVEGAGNLAPWRYGIKCSLCSETKGACVKCADPTCRTHFHVSCAYLAQPACMMAFEIFPVKTSRRESVNTLTFKSESGHMCAQIWCKTHLGSAKSKTTYGYHEVDPKLKLTAMQAYANTHKQVAASSNRNTALVESTHALLRRAKRLEAIQQACGGAGCYIEDGNLKPMCMNHDEIKATLLDTKPSIDSHLDETSLNCVKCHSDWSPLWWPIPNSNNVCCTMCRPDVLGPDIVV